MAHNAFKITFIRTTIIILTGGLMIAKLLHTKSIPTAVYAFVIIVILFLIFSFVKVGE